MAIPVTQAERETILTLHAEGMPKKRIARAINRAPSTVADALGAENRSARRVRESERRLKSPPKRPMPPLPVADTGWFARLTKDQLRAGK